MTRQAAQDRTGQEGSVTQGHVALVSRGLPARGAAAESHALALAITAALQTTLDAVRLVELFAGEVGRVVAHDSVAYANENFSIRFSQGHTARHSCTYRLAVENEMLGEIVFTRRSPFSADELSLLEYLLCGLVYPLRNALEYKRVTDQARKDPLTGVYNRGMLEAVLRRETALAQRHHTPFSILFIDIDRFKEINDRLGHATGDRAIKAIVECIERNMRATDVLARFGGDEFILLLSNTPREGAALVAERVRHAIQGITCLDDADAPVTLTASLGVATLASHDSAESLLARADQSLQRAKQRGRNRIHA